MGQRPKPLAGLKVLDLTRLLPGPLCTLHLADMGAEVIKVEDTGAGDYSRSLGALKTEMSPFFHLANRNKKSIALDLRNADGREVFLKLATDADIIVESFRPGVVDKLGVGYEAVKAINPRIVYCAISGYGQDGPWKDKAGHDLNYLSVAGIAEQIGGREGGPVQANFQIADLAGGTLSAAMGILAAVVDATRTGQGRFVDVSMTDCSFAHGIIQLASLNTFGGTVPRGRDMLTGGLPCYGIYETADGGHMGVGSLEKKFWDMVCDTLGRPDLKEKHTVYGEEADQVRAEVAAIFKTKTRDEWAAIFKDVDCCVTPILTMKEAVAHEQLLARDMVLTLDDPVDGPMTEAAFPIKFSDDHVEKATPAPKQGADTEDVLRGMGLTDAQIAALRDKKIIL